ncbi:glycoside hydrolase family 3 N-terminal domain-containing protein [Agromyces sp. H3Y2-19a]|uniref:glycoside hydrolase family 3 N-terminal domain-containing protein n=1 Tax=Agromyces TaxID=33877 RepID=UPI001E3C2083|nr:MULTISPECIES: glycoside hydrolase family 3 N-terminal domain-containing protein [Agromyces]MCD5347144.1 glycoside hydrolase family 3 protein [Agromyces sp. S2-1-8]MDF0513188.1 glycoside hydrolase family 3 N-terminal domain-containing protein [Agromyces chromiiresistens]
MRSPRLLPPAVLAVAAALLVGCAPASAPTRATAGTEGSATPTAMATPTADASEDWVSDRVSTMTAAEKAAALLMLHAPGTDPGPLRTYLDQGVSGVILMGDNIAGDAASLRALTGALTVDPALPPLIAVDEEGGEVQRLDWDTAASAGTLRAAPSSDTTAAFAARAQSVDAGGANVNFGVIADVTDDPDSFIAGRVLGTDPQAAADRVAAAVRGERGVVATTLKHFPGHGAAPGDSHSSVPSAPLDLAAWRTGPALPFTAGIDAGAELVMTGHLAYPAIDPAPASLSPAWHRILRDELGFDGVVVTDDMLMLQHNGLPEYADPGENAVRAVAAGADLLLYVLPADPSEFGISVDGLVGAITDAVASGRISEARLDDAVTRVLALRRELS